MGGHADGGGVHQSVGRREVRAEVLRGGGFGALAAEASAQRVREGPSAPGLLVDDDEPLHADQLAEQGVGDGGSGAARAELYHGAGRHVGQAADEGAGEPDGVGVVADGAPVAEHDGVDRAERRGLGVQLVEVLDDDLLARMGDVESVETHGARRAEQPAGSLGRDAEPVDVEDAVDHAQPVARGLAVVQGRAERRADPGADQAREVRARVRRRGRVGAGHRALSGVAGGTAGGQKMKLFMFSPCSVRGCAVAGSVRAGQRPR